MSIFIPLVVIIILCTQGQKKKLYYMKIKVTVCMQFIWSKQNKKKPCKCRCSVFKTKLFACQS